MTLYNAMTFSVVLKAFIKLFRHCHEMVLTLMREWCDLDTVKFHPAAQWIKASRLTEALLITLVVYQYQTQIAKTNQTSW